MPEPYSIIVLTPRHTGVNISLGLDKMIESLGLHNGKRKLWSGLCGYFCTIHTMQLGVIDTFKLCPGMKQVNRKAKKIAKFVKEINS